MQSAFDDYGFTLVSKNHGTRPSKDSNPSLDLIIIIIIIIICKKGFAPHTGARAIPLSYKSSPKSQPLLRIIIIIIIIIIIRMA